MKTRKILFFFLVATCLIYPAGLKFASPALAAEPAPSGVRVNLFATASVSGDRYVVTGDLGRIYLVDRTQGIRTPVDSGTTRALVSVCFPDGLNGWAVGQGGLILHSGDSGQTWKEQDSGVDRYLFSVDFVDAEHGMAVGTDSTVLITVDGGKIWKRSSFRVPSEFEEEFALFAVEIMDTQGACIAGDYGRIFITEDAGRTWEEAPSPLYDQEMMEGKVIYALAHDRGVLYAAGIDCALVSSRDRGKTWTETDTGFPGPEIYCIEFVEGIGMAAGSGGHVIRTMDQGTTWNRVQVPEGVSRAWLNGMTLGKDASGKVNGLIVGRNGTMVRIVDGKPIR